MSNHYFFEFLAKTCQLKPYFFNVLLFIKQCFLFKVVNSALLFNKSNIILNWKGFCLFFSLNPLIHPDMKVVLQILNR